MKRKHEFVLLMDVLTIVVNQADKHYFLEKNSKIVHNIIQLLVLKEPRYQDSLTDAKSF